MGAHAIPAALREPLQQHCGGEWYMGTQIHMAAPRVGAVVDDREFALAACLRSRHASLGLSKARLPIGDVQIVQDGRVALVLERKTRADLRASLLDGRFADQRSRLVRQYGLDRCGYVVEGGTCWAENESGAEVALMVRDYIRVFWSQSVSDTADLIARLARSNLTPRSVPPDGSRIPPRAPAAASANASEKAVVSMLQSVPGMSRKRSMLVASLYPSMCDLTRSIASDKAETIGKIAECKDGSAGRRFGRTLAQRVVACLTGEADGAADDRPVEPTCLMSID